MENPFDTFDAPADVVDMAEPATQTDESSSVLTGPNPVSTPDAAPTSLAVASWVADKLEGGEPFQEKNGDVTRYGIGDSGGYSAGMKAETPEEAGQIILDKYASLPGIKENFEQLKDPRDQAAVLQLALHRPAWAQRYFKENPISEDKPFDRNDFLDFQQGKYEANPGKYTQGFLDRVADTRGFDPAILKKKAMS